MMVMIVFAIFIWVGGGELLSVQGTPFGLVDSTDRAESSQVSTSKQRTAEATSSFASGASRQDRLSRVVGDPC